MVARSLTLVSRNCTETFATHVTMFATFRFVNKLPADEVFNQVRLQVTMFGTFRFFNKLLPTKF